MERQQRAKRIGTTNGDNAVRCLFSHKVGGEAAIDGFTPRTPENYPRTMPRFADTLKSMSPYDTRNAPWKVRKDGDVLM